MWSGWHSCVAWPASSRWWGVQLQVNAYLRAHAKHRQPVDEWWLVVVYTVMIAVVALFCVVYPILFVVLD